ncbi:conserved hypothetical protein [Methanosalsum zhilinae DSM 4017]|uniref:Restriction system protein Mrr-like N-terminal domain-containing protein n=1 Tax=Methanosalsum zhilinae (strain DSM 4017 / NBRC 107636 / OCM 62 / WeN5) TaxID=679901 RepID=F7XQ53_METZD|nr:hypothetical protein [Methanosalsum zhilinae]AEH60414.1 conserved hypothetical protein [Methanosalsum zhilinae DSM 4017]
MMTGKVDAQFEKEVADYYQSLGIGQGPGDIQYRLILRVLESNKDKITEFSDIRKYTDQFADRGSIGSKMKVVFQRNDLVVKVKHGGYRITNKGLIAANFLKLSTLFYKETNRMDAIMERIP